MLRSIPLGCADLPLSAATAIAEAVAAVVGVVRPLMGLPVVALLAVLLDHTAEAFVAAAV